MSSGEIPSWPLAARSEELCELGAQGVEDGRPGPREDSLPTLARRERASKMAPSRTKSGPVSSRNPWAGLRRLSSSDEVVNPNATSSPALPRAQPLRAQPRRRHLLRRCTPRSPRWLARPYSGVPPRAAPRCQKAPSQDESLCLAVSSSSAYLYRETGAGPFEHLCLARPPSGCRCVQPCCSCAPRRRLAARHTLRRAGPTGTSICSMKASSSGTCTVQYGKKKPDPGFRQKLFIGMCVPAPPGVFLPVYRGTRPLRGSVSCGSGWSLPCVSILLTLSQLFTVPGTHLWR